MSRIFNCLRGFNPVDRSMERTSASLSPIHHDQNAAASTTRYQIFINHRGPDVKSTLADLIYHRLHEKGLQVFLDKDEFQPGQPLNPTIEEAIRASSVHIAIFSKRYAESDWCLKELRLMLETGAPIIPVFYEVQPSDLRWIEQGKGQYVSAFAEHEKKGRFDSQTISAWKSALNRVSYISGLDFCQRPWGQFLKSLEDTVFQILKPVLLHVATHPVGLDEAIREFERFLERQQKNANMEVKIVGIAGLAGSGKTTLAKEFFNRKRRSFQKSSFLFDVRDASHRHALPGLQNKLLQDLSSNRDYKISSASEGKGIIRETLQSLAPRPCVLIILDDIDHEEQIDALLAKDVLGSDSLVIITSRDAEPLRLCEASIYKINALSPHHAQRLFCHYAFNRPSPIVGFEDLVQKFCEKCGGLPLFLKVIGAHLRVNAKNDETEGKTILEFIPDIFVHKDVSKILNVTYNALSPKEKHIFLDIACFFLGEDRDLAIKVWDTCERNGSFGLNTVMNKCLVELDGNNCFKMHDLLRDFGREIANKETPFRLWNENQAADLRRKQKRNRDFPEFRGIIAATRGPDSESRTFSGYADGCSSYYKPPLEEIELSELKILAIRGDYINEQIGGNLENLAWLRWFECPYPNIWSCVSSMKNLTVLELFGPKMEEWPLPSEQVRLRELRELRLVRTNLISISIPATVCPCLEHLDLISNYHLMEVNYLPPNLLKLKLAHCTKLKHIQALEHLPQLRALNLSDCFKLGELPALGHLLSLETLHVSWCFNLQHIQALEHLPQLQALNLSGCRALRELPALGHLLSLETLHVSECSNLQHIQALEHLPQLRALNLSMCRQLRELPALGHLLSLETLDVSGCYNLQHIQALEHLPQLRTLNLCWCSELRELPALGHLLSLETLDVSECSNLQHIQALEHLPQLRLLNISGCSELQQLPNLAREICLKEVRANGCWKLQGIQGLDQLERLESLTLSTADSRAIWNAIAHMEKLPRRMCLSARAPRNFLHIDARYFNIANLPAVDLNTPRRRHQWKLLFGGEEKNTRTSFILSFVVQFRSAGFRQVLSLIIVDENDRTVVAWRTSVKEGEWLYALCLRECNFTSDLHTARLSSELEHFCGNEIDYEVESGWMATGGEEEILEAVQKLFVP